MALRVLLLKLTITHHTISCNQSYHSETGHDRKDTPHESQATEAYFFAQERSFLFKK